jgi:hypothetical protein
VFFVKIKVLNEKELFDLSYNSGYNEDRRLFERIHKYFSVNEGIEAHSCQEVEYWAQLAAQDSTLSREARNRTNGIHFLFGG